MAEVTGVTCTRQTMLTISRAPDRIVSWSALSILPKIVEKLNKQDLLLNFFKLVQDLLF